MLVPYSLGQARNRRYHERQFAKSRRELAKSRRELSERRAPREDVFDYERAVDFLVRERGLDETQVRQGSMPLPALEFSGRMADSHLPSNRPLFGLQVGNFVGISLAYFSWLLRRRHAGSVMVSIDPNITHRGIEDPQSHVWGLLADVALLDASLIVTAYSLEQSIGDVPRGGADVVAERRGEHALANLAAVAPHRFDFAVLDGNHDGDYLEREFRQLHRLLAPDAVVIVDDVEDNWAEVLETFDLVAHGNSGFMELARGERAGVLQLRA
jgi:hypothetical protein